MTTCVQVGREKWVQVLCMYDHLCTGRKGEVGAGVVYVCPPVCRPEGGCDCRWCVHNYVYLCTGRKGEVGAGVVYVRPPVCRLEGGYGCTPVSIIMFTCVQVVRQKWLKVLCMYKYDHLCVGRKGEADAGVVYVCSPVYRSEGRNRCRCCIYVYPPVYRSEGGSGCRCCVCNYVHLCVGRKGEADAGVVYV